MCPLKTVLIAALSLTPPAGRPPMGPLQRHDPKVYDVLFDVTVVTTWQYDGSKQENFRVTEAPIVMPVIFQGAWSAVQPDSLRRELWLEGRADEGLVGRSRIDGGYPFNTHVAVITLPQFEGKTFRWRLGYRAQVWSSRLVSEEAAAAAAWPREWPAEVRDGLQPQMYIQSDAPVFAETVARLSSGRLRLVPPYLAAKDLIRSCLQSIRVTGDGNARGYFEVLHGLEVQGALRTAELGLGSPHDLVCVCVATLRAAGIPARPVIGIQERLRADRQVTEFRSWAEFYLPEIGWVPFDPMEMRGSVNHLDVRRPWPDFGTMDDLNERIPLAYHFLPPAAVESPMYPAVWGWDPRPARTSAEQRIQLQMISRGAGVDDPG